MHTMFGGPSTVAKKLIEFNPQQFYSVNVKGGVQLREKGIELIAQYYNEMRECEITIPKDSEGNYDGLVSFAKNISDKLEEARKHEGEFRQAFSVGVLGHATPVIYLKEEINGSLQEGILMVDSQGGTETEARTIREQTGLTVFDVTEQSQDDFFSCFAYSINICANATAKDPETKEHKVPHLLSRLQESFAIHGKTILPEELQKNVQNSEFDKIHRLHPETIVHLRKEKTPTGIVLHPETLSQFRSRYPDKEKQKISGFLKEKGRGYARMIQAQVYLKQMEALVGTPLDFETKKQFIERAKQQKWQDLFKLANTYLNEIQDKVEQKQSEQKQSQQTPNSNQ